MSAGTAIKLDAVIVGAGPAGSAAAILLARAGWAVALVERQPFPRRKVCGECIAASNLPLLDALGIGPALARCAGPALHEVTLLHGEQAVTAALPAAAHERHPWGRALGRETLDSLLLEQARAQGVRVLQPFAVQAIQGCPGAWHCELRAADAPTLLRLRAALVIDAHGSWEDLPTLRPQRRLARAAGDLFAFKANYSGSALPEGRIAVLALDGGYGGMVVGDGGSTTVACCLRRDRLSRLRSDEPGLRAGDAVQAWLLRGCGGVRQALLGARRDGAWLAAGPLGPGVRLSLRDEIFRVGNAAGEAHPILGEGMSMALQSAALLCSHLLGTPPGRQAPAALRQAQLQQAYASAWQRHFLPRMRVASVFAHAAMRPRSAALLMALAGRWPDLLTRGARWGGKVQALAPALHGTLAPLPSPAHLEGERP